MSVLSFLQSWQFVLFFYASVFLLVYKNKDKFDFQARFIALYRTNIGLKVMDKLAKKHSTLIKRLSLLAVFIGYLGMLVISFVLVKGVYDFLYHPELPSPIQPVLPGVSIPGTQFKLPFWSGIISLFLVIVIHEFSHGVVARAFKIPVKSSGFVLFGPIPGAFVEPNEESLKKKPLRVQNSVFAAGPFSNILSALIVAGLFAALINPLTNAYFQPVGVSFTEVVKGSPAEKAGLKTGVVYTFVNGEEVRSVEDFLKALKDLKPGEEVVISNDEESVTITSGAHPQNKSSGYLGVKVVSKLSNESSPLFTPLLTLISFLNVFVTLSLGLGLANLLPLGPVDGGRMFQLACWKLLGKEKGDAVWARTALIVLLVLVILLLPVLRETALWLFKALNSFG